MFILTGNFICKCNAWTESEAVECKERRQAAASHWIIINTVALPLQQCLLGILTAPLTVENIDVASVMAPEL